MYRPGSGTGRQIKYQGMGSCAPDIIQTEEGREQEWRASVEKIIADLIKDEDEAIIKYQQLMDQVHRRVWNSQIAEIAHCIQNQETQHKALLKRLQAQLKV